MSFTCRSHVTRRRDLIAILVAAGLGLFTTSTLTGDDAAQVKVGTHGAVGCADNAKRVRQLVITEPGVYENYLVDGEWGGSTLVKINADNVTLRRCEIRHGRHNAVTVYAKNVVIDSCRIHHVLAGSFREQHDAHGITGRPTGLSIRNCDIGLVSGDCIQFDPGRGMWDDVLVENCTLWTGPLPADAADFKKGERPGENAVDTKQQISNPRSRLTIRNCLMTGWNQPGQISNMAALNLKNYVQVNVQNCVFRDNEICFRLRGSGGEREFGGAQVTIDNCAVYNSLVAVRAENQIENLKIRKLGTGQGVERKFQGVGGGTGAGYENTDERVPPPYESVLKTGLAR